MDETRTTATERSGNELLVIMACSLYWAWMFSVYVGDAVVGTFDLTLAQYSKAAGAFGVCVGLAVWFAALPPLKRMPRWLVCTLGGAAPIVLCLYTFFKPAFIAPSIALPLLMLCSGLSAANVLGSLGSELSLLTRKRSAADLCISSAIGGVLTVLIGQLTFPASLITTACLLPVALVLLQGAKCTLPVEGARERHSALRAMGERRGLLLWMFFYSFVFGFVVAAAADHSSDFGMRMPTFVNMITCIPGLVLLLVLTRTHIRIDFESMRRLLLALAIAGLAPTLFAQDASLFLCVAIITITFGMFDIATFITLLEIVREHDLPRLSTFLLGRIPCELGIPLGWVVGGISTHITIMGYGANLVVTCACVVVLVIGLALTSDAGAGREKREEAYLPQKDTFASAGETGQTPANMRENFEAIVTDLARTYELSPRETEVFIHLASGRTPRWIAKTLVTSESTAKSHTHRIYQKMGVHTMQELLDVVEQRSRSHRTPWGDA